MTTFANALKDEIRRLARKEIRAQTAKHARAIAQYRREIARLKRQQREQEKKIGQLTSEARKPTAGASPAEHLNGSLRFSARSVRAQRRRTGLSAADYAKLVGVSPLTIYNWEHGKSRPRNGQFEKLVALRGIGKRQAQLKITELRRPKASMRSLRARGRKPK
jgi:DNA-binding transcriptional regulator YiaG